MHSNGKKFNIAWEQVEPLTNESTVEGYKVAFLSIQFYFQHLCRNIHVIRVDL